MRISDLGQIWIDMDMLLFQGLIIENLPACNSEALSNPVIMQ